MAIARHLGKARYPAILGLAIVTVVLFARIQLTNQNRAEAAMLLLAPTSSELASTLIRVGLGPEQLAAAGVSPSAAETVVGNVLDHLLANPGSLDLADGAWAESKAQCARLKRLIRAGGATSEQIAAYQTAKSQYAKAGALRNAELDTLFAAATADLGADRRGTLAALRANAAWDLPIEYLVVERTEAQWVALRDCLANERTAAKVGEDPDPAAQAALAQVRSNPLVAAAKMNRDATLAVLTAAWEDAMTD